jgi:hypothetical protein
MPPRHSSAAEVNVLCRSSVAGEAAGRLHAALAPGRACPGPQQQPAAACRPDALLLWRAGAAGASAAVVPVAGLCQDLSRHRFKHAPPPTPEGFWDMGFGDSLDSRMD